MQQTKKYFLYFLEKIGLDISGEISDQQLGHKKCQVFFSLKKQQQKNKTKTKQLCAKHKTTILC